MFAGMDSGGVLDFESISKLVLSLPSWFHFYSIVHALTLYEYGFLFTSLYMWTVIIANCFQYPPSTPLCLASQVLHVELAVGRTKVPDHGLYIPVSHGEETYPL